MGLYLIGRWLIGLGIVIAIAGAVLMLGGRVGLGRLPGDFLVRRGPATFYFPLVTCLLLSVGLTILLNLIARWRR